MRSATKLAIAALLPVVLPAGAPMPQLSGPAEPVLEVVSSRADQVTGGDARLRIRLPHGSSRNGLHIEAQGVDVTRDFAMEPDGRSLTGVVTGLRTGWNTVTARVGTRHAAVTLRSRPTLSGAYQYPFVCKTDRNGLGQPIVDNHKRRGLRVFAENPDGSRKLKVVGWSRDCEAAPRVDYLYRTSAGQFRPLRGRERPRDIAETKTFEGKAVPYVVRRGRGTVNRFVYSMATLIDYVPGGDPRAMPIHWNGRLIYRFGGGIGVGHDQGVLAEGDALYHEGLSLGYA